jgi:hypothetical protein
MSPSTIQAFMPERSKGLDSSSSSFDCVGSNPTECIFCYIFVSFAIRGPTNDCTVVGQLMILLSNKNTEHNLQIFSSAVLILPLPPPKNW